MEHPEWTIQGWTIKFLLSEKLLHQIEKISRADNWYEDPIVVDTWMEKMHICFNSIQQFYSAFGVIPQGVDRLFDEDTGMIIQGRSIDEKLKTITFTLTL